MPGKRVLLVEGRDDEHVVKSICGRWGLGTIDRIEQQEGKDPLLDVLPVKLQESDLAVLGIIMDADTDLAARWQGLADRLSAAGYESVGSLPDPKGTVFIPPGNSLLPKCRIPDDCIDKNRYPLFMARSVLRELIESLPSTRSL